MKNNVPFTRNFS